MSRFGSMHDEEDEILDGDNGGAFVVRRESDEDGNVRSDSPRTALLSAIDQSRDSLSIADRNSLRRPSRRERERRRSSTYRELLKLLVSEDAEAKQSRRTLEVALERLQTENQRAQLAEQRALEMAARFKQVNDARIVAQREADRLSQELRLYRDQLDVAQKELLKGQDLMRDLEAQRDDAEAVAARARSTARRLREQQLVTLAREDGRRMGYQEGLRRGYEEVGVTPPSRIDARVPPGRAMQGEYDDDGDDTGRITPPGQYTSGVLNLPSPPTGAPPIPPSDVDTLDDPGPSRRRQNGDYANTGAQGSRFMENMTPATMAPIPLPDRRQSSGPQSWPPPPSRDVDEEGFPRPIPIRTASPAPHHPDYSIPPDNYVPSVDSDNYISLPPPHELARAPPAIGQVDDPSRGPPDSRSGPSQSTSRDYAYRRPASPRSMTESLPSTNMTISDFDLVSAPRTRPSTRERGPILSAIPEAEFSPPSSDARARGGAMPEPVTFPVPSSRPESGYMGSDAGRRPSSRHSRRDDVSAAGSSRRRKPPPIQDEAPENVRHSNASVAEWLEKQSSPEHEHRASPIPDQRSRYRQPYVTDVTEEDRLPSPYERPPSSATGSASRHHRSRSGSLNRPFVPPPLPLDDDRRGASPDDSIEISIQLPSGTASQTSPAHPLESGKLAPDGSVRRSRTPQQHFVIPPIPMPTSPMMRDAPSMSTLQSMPQMPSGFMPMGAPPVVYNQSMPPAAYNQSMPPSAAYSSPRASHRRFYSQPELEEGPVVPMMPSNSSSGSKARPARGPAPALTRASSRASGSQALHSHPAAAYPSAQFPAYVYDPAARSGYPDLPRRLAVEPTPERRAPAHPGPERAQVYSCAQLSSHGAPARARRVDLLRRLEVEPQAREHAAPRGDVQPALVDLAPVSRGRERPPAQPEPQRGADARDNVPAALVQRRGARAAAGAVRELG
ncbi:hypothetical protein EVJ58_g6738, partial [Rhodofomes roseus]